jgi:nucleoside 2-deoxyribosyltransferase
MSITSHLRQREGDDPFSGKAFVVMPFSRLMDQIYDNQIYPCLCSMMKEGAQRADEIKAVGYVVCEKICKPIQEAQVVVAELSTGNSNVFYELGLAVALGKHIIPLIQDGKEADEKTARILDRMALPETRACFYRPFTFLPSHQVRVHAHVWHDSVFRLESQRLSFAPDCVNVLALLADGGSFQEQVSGTSMAYRIDDICESVICASLDKLPRAERAKHVIRMSDAWYSHYDFPEILSQIRAANLVIVCTSTDEPLSYFCLGYSHGLGKYTIPITAIGPKCHSSQEKGQAKPVAEPGLPFDVRALWHIHFTMDTIDDLRQQLDAVLGLLLQDEHNQASQVTARKLAEPER